MAHHKGVDVMKEVWKEIKGFEGLYSVSNYGRVKNERTSYVLKNVPHHTGYLVVNLRGKVCQVHRLVAEAFIPNVNNLETVNHINKDKKDNRVSNLEWMSNADNITHGQGKKVAQILNGEILNIYNSSEEAARLINAHGSIIRACCRKEHGRRTHKGYEWRYV
jgi:hypothetical protein